MITHTLERDPQSARTAEPDCAREYLLKARAALEGAADELANLSGQEKAALAPMITEVSEAADALKDAIEGSPEPGARLPPARPGRRGGVAGLRMPRR